MTASAPVVVPGTLVTSLPAVVTSIKLLASIRPVRTGNRPLGLGGLGSVVRLFVLRTSVTLGGLRLGALSLLGLPAVSGFFLPALIGLAMDVPIFIRKDIVGPVLPHISPGTITGRLGLCRHAGLIALAPVHIVMRSIAATRAIACTVTGIVPPPVTVTIPASIAAVAARPPPAPSIPPAEADGEAKRPGTVA